MRLTHEGTQRYNYLDRSGKRNFLDDLVTELSKIILVSKKRLSLNEITQIDFETGQVRIFLDIEPSEVKRSVTAIVEDLNTMILFKDISPIGINNITNFLDSDYGYKSSEYILTGILNFLAKITCYYTNKSFF